MKRNVEEIESFPPHSGGKKNFLFGYHKLLLHIADPKEIFTRWYFLTLWEKEFCDLLYIQVPTQEMITRV